MRDNREQVVELSGRQVDYTYDALSQLLSETITEPGGATRQLSYTYDPAGNRLSRTDQGNVVSYTYDANDRLTDANGIVFTYDDNGSLLSRSDGGQETLYGYDNDRRLTSIAGPSGTQVSFEYDATGIQTRRVVNGTQETNFLVDRDREHSQTLLETDAADSLLASYIYGDDLITSNIGAQTLYPLYDGQVSTRQLTDTAGAVTDTYTYDAFGRTLSQSGSSSHPYRYPGERQNAEFDLYNLRARYLDADLGRFLTADRFPPDLQRPLTLNRYAYVTNNPVNMIDPSGQVGSTVEQSIVVSLVDLMGSLWPTLVAGGIAFTSVARFIGPGFQMIQAVQETFALPPVTTEEAERALQVYQNGQKMIKLGVLFNEIGQKGLSVLQLGLGLGGLAGAIAKGAGSAARVSTVVKELVKNGKRADAVGTQILRGLARDSSKRGLSNLRGLIEELGEILKQFNGVFFSIYGFIE